MTLDDLINDWNGAAPIDARVPLLNDETLRDGLQSPSVRDPDIAAKRDLIHRLARMGVDAVDLGMPGAGPMSLAAVRALMVEIRDHRLPISPNVAVRTLEADLIQVAEIACGARAGAALTAGLAAPPVWRVPKRMLFSVPDHISSRSLSISLVLRTMRGVMEMMISFLFFSSV